MRLLLYIPFAIDQTLLCGSVTVSMYLYVHVHVCVHFYVHIYVFVYVASPPIYTKKIPVSTITPKLAYFMKKLYQSDEKSITFLTVLTTDLLAFSFLFSPSFLLSWANVIPSFLANLLTCILDSFSSWLLRVLAVVIISSVFCTFNFLHQLLAVRTQIYLHLSYLKKSFYLDSDFLPPLQLLPVSSY